MRLALVSMIALTAAAGVAVAQTETAPPAASAPATAAPATATPTTTTPAAPAPTEAPASPATPAAAGTAPAAEAPAAPVAETPPAPPAPPTDPTAIGVLSVLQSVCIPAANGGNLDQLAKAAGYRKSGDNWSLRQRDYSLTIEDPGSNPTQCHVDVTHPVDAEAPGRTIIVALHDWAALENGWTLYRNDKSVQGDGVEYTTRSWTHQTDSKSESLVFITRRHPDGTPMQHSADTSELIYGVAKTAG